MSKGGCKPGKDCAHENGRMHVSKAHEMKTGASQWRDEWTKKAR